MTPRQKIIKEEFEYIKKYGEIVTKEEFYLICEAADVYRPPGEKWYSKHRDLTPLGRKIGASIASVATLGAYGLFRKLTDKCRQTCRGIEGSRHKRCIAVCNMNAAKRVIGHINSRKGKLSSIKDPQKRKEAKRIIDAEKDKWMARHDKYKNQVASLGAMVTQG